jgi:hypothetical protein
MTPLCMNSILGSTRVVKTNREEVVRDKHEINQLETRKRHAHLQRPFPARKCRQSPERVSRSLRPPVLSSATSANVVTTPSTSCCNVVRRISNLGPTDCVIVCCDIPACSGVLGLGNV